MMTDTTIAVSTTTAEKRDQARLLATRLNLDFIEDPQSDSAKTFHYLLLLTPDYLGLHKTSDKKLSPFFIDFLSGKMLYRSQQAGMRKELLARAMGVKSYEHPIIIDATAGLGRDSFILATLGFNVTLFERSPILHALLEEALFRASKNVRVAPVIERMHLVQGDAISWLEQSTSKADIIYLDPMFPQRQKSASIKKEMAILQELLGKDEDAEALFNLAISCATRRVVVKRPRLAVNITAQTPSFSLSGKSSRFDIYLTPR